MLTLVGIVIYWMGSFFSPKRQQVEDQGLADEERPQQKNAKKMARPSLPVSPVAETTGQSMRRMIEAGQTAGLTAGPMVEDDIM